MRIVLTTNAGRQTFENVLSVSVVADSLYVICDNGNRKSPEVNKRLLTNCIDLYMEFTSVEKKTDQR